MRAGGLGEGTVGDADTAFAGITARVRQCVQRHTGMPDEQAQQYGKTKFSSDFRHVPCGRRFAAWFNGV